MENFWADIRRRSWRIFKSTGKELKFVWGLLVAVALAVAALAGADWPARLTALLKLSWVPVAAIGLLALSSLMKAFRENAAELHGRIKQQTDAEAAEVERRRELAEGLRRYRTQGIDLLEGIERTYVIPLDQQRFNTWHHNVSLFIQQALLDRYDDWRLPVPAIPMRDHPGEGAQAINRLRVLLGRLSQLIEWLEPPR